MTSNDAPNDKSVENPSPDVQPDTSTPVENPSLDVQPNTSAPNELPDATQSLRKLQKGVSSLWQTMLGDSFNVLESFAVFIIAAIRWLIILLVAWLIITVLSSLFATVQAPLLTLLWDHMGSLAKFIILLGWMADAGRVLLQDKTLPSKSSKSDAAQAVKDQEEQVSASRRQRSISNRAAINLFLISLSAGSLTFIITNLQQGELPGYAQTLSIITTLITFTLVMMFQAQYRPALAVDTPEDTTSAKPPKIDVLFDFNKDHKPELDELYKRTATKVQDNIDWYTKNAKLKKQRAQSIRFLSLALLGFGSVTPVLIDVFNLQDRISPSIATVLIASGTGLIALDRFWGFSTGWIRFLTTEMQLKARQEVFLYEWNLAMAQYGKPEFIGVSAMIERCQNLRTEVNTVVQEETKLWVEEFQANLRNYDANLKTIAEASEPGSINIEIENIEILKSSKWRALMDNREMGTYKGNRAGIERVLPGRHRIQITDEAGNETLTEAVVHVTSGQTCEIKFKLPKPSEAPNG